ncbi:MAG: AAA family ATPase [Anaerolineae bacterium]|nr:AAA family ATPase [Anaerolineae bacterium]
MHVTHLLLKNWRNFHDVDVSLGETTYLLGANASGKSNLLDVFRFLRDISKTQGGGLQKAIADRGGISKLRCLHARRDPEVRVEVNLAEDSDTSWRYVLGFKPEGKGAHHILISAEEVWQNQRDCLFKISLLLKDLRARLYSETKGRSGFFGQNKHPGSTQAKVFGEGLRLPGRHWGFRFTRDKFMRLWRTRWQHPGPANHAPNAESQN